MTDDCPLFVRAVRTYEEKEAPVFVEPVVVPDKYLDKTSGTIQGENLDPGNDQMAPGVVLPSDSDDDLCFISVL